MPTPHYPVRAGAHRPQAAPTADSQPSAACPACAEKSTEIERLRNELAHARSGATSSPGRLIGMWAALAICAACIVFALAAMLRHG
ncbi:MAG TPA: hypothetical protein VKT77_04825 [Chthonomonadaceae bacterium]|nr:hypothetical protein [Chthonomonadaceae bacterium]